MKREYGIDLMRVFAMVLVILGHIVGAGGVVEASEIGTSQHYMAVFLQVFSMCSINVFGLISGYVGYGKKLRFRALIKIWLRVLFWTMTITLLFFILGWIEMDDNLVRKTMLPVISKTYWYITAYFIVIILSPLLNIILKKMNIWLIYISVICGAALLSIVITTSGNNAIWLMLLYIIGATIRKSNVLQYKKYWIGIAGFGISVIITYAAIIAQENGAIIWNKTLWAIWGGRSDGLWPSSITMLIAAIFVLEIGINIRTSQKMNDLLKKTTPLILSVYLIHVHPLIFNSFNGKFIFLTRNSFALEGILIILITLIVFLTCMILGLGQEKLFYYIECNIDKMYSKRKKEEDL